MYCAVCGTNNDDSALHCIQCGARLGAAQPPPPVAVVPVPAAAGTVGQSSYYASTIQPLQIQTLQPASGPQMQFFKLQLQ